VKLGELQEMLARAISEPDSVRPELLQAGISVRAPLDGAARTNIYREMYRFRLADALRADFPRVARLLGDDGFLELSAAYASVYPSASSDISRFGRHLADFLSAHPGPRGDEADLARLEWALAEAFTTQEALGQLGEAAAEARFGFVPALKTLVLEHDVLPLWAELETSDEPPAVDKTGAHVAVWRQGFQVLHRSLGVEEAEALARARAGATLAEVCEPFGLTADPQREAFRTLAGWFSSGLVASVDGP